MQYIHTEQTVTPDSNVNLQVPPKGIKESKFLAYLYFTFSGAFLAEAFYLAFAEKLSVIAIWLLAYSVLFSLLGSQRLAQKKDVLVKMTSAVQIVAFLTIIICSLTPLFR